MSAKEKDHNASNLKRILNDIDKAVQSAEKFLDKAKNATDDAKTTKQINEARSIIVGFLEQLKKMQKISDNDSLSEDIAKLKMQSSTLRTLRDKIKQIDAATAAEVAGYMEQVVTFLSQANSFLSELP